MTKASADPALVCPGKAPAVTPATYAPEASTATLSAWSKSEDPNWRVHRTLPLASYLRRKASPDPALVWPGRVPPVGPAAETPGASTARPLARRKHEDSTRLACGA